MRPIKGYALLYWLPAFLLGVYLVLRYAFNDFSLQHSGLQMFISRVLLITLLFTFFKVYWYGKQIFKRAESPYSLAVLRLVVFALPAWYAIHPDYHLSNTLLRQWIDLPDTDRVPLPFMGYYSMHIPISRHIIDVIQPLFLLVSVTAFVGLFTRVSVIIYAVLAFYLFSICHLYGKPVNNHYLIWFPIVLACSDCGRLLSADALITRLRTRQWPDDQRSRRYTVAVNAALLLLGILYFFPGFWKIWNCGLDWVFRYNLRNIFYTKWIELNGWQPVFRFDRSEILMAAIALFSVLFELVFVFWAMARRHSILLLIGGISFHYGVLYFTQINFTYLLPLYACLFDWGYVADKLKKFMHKPRSGVAAEVALKLTPSGVVLLALVTGNILCGFTKIVSWPFACFPTFDYMVPEKVDVIVYEGYKGGKPSISDFMLRRVLNNTFSSYNVAARENRIIGFYSQHDSIALRAASVSLFNAVQDSVSVDSVILYKVNRRIEPGTERLDENKERIDVVLTPCRAE